MGIPNDPLLILSIYKTDENCVLRVLFENQQEFNFTRPLYLLIKVTESSL